MKQHITIQQLDKLSDKGKEKLRKWWKPEKGQLFCELTTDKSKYIHFEWSYEPFIEGWNFDKDISLPLLSIGQMIDFLDLNIVYLENEAGWWGIKTFDDLDNTMTPMYPELCDALWEAVKDVLEEDARGI